MGLKLVVVLGSTRGARGALEDCLEVGPVTTAASQLIRSSCCWVFGTGPPPPAAAAGGAPARAAAAAVALLGISLIELLAASSGASFAWLTLASEGSKSCML